MGFTGTARFELVRKLGEGGMGVVYEAFDHERDMSVALKTLRNLDATSLYRFKREFRALSDVSHPNIVGLYELISHGDDWFFTMELLEGGDFIRYVRPGADGAMLPTATMSPTSQETMETREVQVLEMPTDRDEVTDETPAAPPYPSNVDDRRLRRGLVQLAQALDAIHRAGMVHRDLKPSNVRVTPAGRIVLMDFGIVAEASAPVDDSDEPRAIGTPSFMAPEQAAGAPATAAADWYAFGVMLYIALTGRLPFSGPRDAVLIAKQSQDPVSPDRVAEDVPYDLARLCIELVQRDPSARPSGEEVLMRLGVNATAAPESTTMGGSVFVGRSRELTALRQAYDEAREGTAVACLVIGNSGMGKSTLVRRFAHELGAGAARVRDAPVVVRGRCHERESLPYKAFDGIVNHLTHFLVGVSRERAAELLPEDVNLLTRLFPVLRRVPGVQTARPLGGLDRQELRRRAFAVLRELLSRIAAWRPLVVGIDDLQWADEDSIDLLEALLAPPNPPPLLLIAAVRAENLDSQDPAVQRALQAVGVAGAVHRLELEPLAPDEQDQLVGRLMGSDATAFDSSLWRQSAGSPFFLGELVRYARERGTLDSEDAPALDQVLRERIDRLPDGARALLQAVAVAGEPTPLGALAEAVDLDAAARERALAVLRVGHMVRVARHGQDPAVAPYHDRIRETLVERLDAEELRDLHYRLAQALERGGGTVDALARHWLGAGDREHAISYLTSAAEAAGSVLAFGRAAELYRAALDLGGHDDDTARALREGMADALALAGRYYEAAVAYREAATGTNEDDALELTRKSADNFLRSGHVTLGLDALGAVMKQLGITFAGTHRRALMSLAWQRVRFFFRGMRYTQRSEPEIAVRDLGRLDTLFAASTTLGVIDHVRGADLQTRHLLQALRLGEEHRVIRALSIEAVFRAAAGGRGLRRAESLSREVEIRARRIGEPYLVAVALVAVAASAFLGARPRAAVETFAEVEELLSQCVGADWERITSRFMACLAQVQLGELDAVARAGTRFTAEAESRNDVYARNLFATQPTTWRHLLADQPGQAFAALERALEGWPDHTFYMAHYFVAAARSIVHLYQGDPASAAKVLDDIWPGMRRSQLHRFRWLMVEYLHYRSLAAWGTGDLKQVRRMIRYCESFGREAGFGMAKGHRGFLALHQGNESRGLELLLEAQQMMDSAGFRAIARGHRYRLATLNAGAEGERIQQECLDWFAAQGAQVPERFIGLFVPPLPERLRLALPQPSV